MGTSMRTSTKKSTKKAFFSLIALLLVTSIALPGCGKKKEDTKDTTKADATTAEPTTTEPPTTKKILEHLSLETPAGAVIIGTIKKDDDGWYLEPEQKTSVKLLINDEHVETFDNLTRISMYAFKDDNVDKTVYQNDVVTITGMLQNFRGAGNLYIFPCKIERGKTVEAGYAVPDLEYPKSRPVEYDAKKPLPAAMNPIVKDGHYEYNPYILSRNTLEGMGNDYANFYVGFVEAFLNYKTSCPCAKQDYADNFTNIMFDEFPLFTADGEYSNVKGYDENTHTLTWSYTSKDKAEHDKLIADFKEAANKFLKNVDSSASEQVKAQQLYHAFCPLMTYDYEVLKTRDHVEPFYAYMKGRGVCTTFAIAMAQLYSQIGVKATIASGNNAKNEGHLWNVITINGKNYFSDITYELSSDSGKNYKYFGITLDDRLGSNEGYKESNIIIGGAKLYTTAEMTFATQRLDIIK